MRQRGATLIEAIVAAGIIGILVVGISQFFSSTFQSQRRARIRTVFQFIAQDVENKIRTPSSLYLSILDEGNVDLIKCLLGSLDGCTTRLIAHDVASPNYFALAYPTGTASFDRMSGFPAEPVFFNTQGLKCKEGGDLECVFQVDTFFFATCPGGEGKTCLEGAEEIHVGYEVSQRPGTLAGMKPFAPLPKAVNFFTHRVEDILGPFTSSECNPGAIISGYDSRGRAICVCTPPYVSRTESPTENRRGPICRRTMAAELTCPENLVFRGLRSDGTANCVDPSEAYNCIELEKTIAETASCPAGYWVQEDHRQGCAFYCTMPKINSIYRGCSSNEAAENRIDGYKKRVSGVVGCRSSCPEGTVTSALKNDDCPAACRVDRREYAMGLVCNMRRLVCCQPQ
ncbi:MAG: hypothetical protein HYW48_06240 [Deltaproteobacteria bacterium]|nr:hypothetical protein [Deltaproteobacteria bacterium]